MADPLLPSNIADELREMRRRLERLEMAGRLTSASMTDGALRILDETGATRVVFGRDTDGGYGLSVYNENGRTIFKVNESGQTAPRLFPSVMQFADWVPGTALAYNDTTTLRPLCSGYIYATSPSVFFDFYALTSGPTVEHDVQIAEAGGGAYTTVLGPWTGSNAQRGGTFTIPAAALVPGTGTDPVGRTFEFRIRGRITGGTGQAYAAPLLVSSP